MRRNVLLLNLTFVSLILGALTLVGFVACVVATALDASSRGLFWSVLCLILPWYGCYHLFAHSSNKRRKLLALLLVLLPALAFLLFAAAFMIFAESSPVLPFEYAAGGSLP
jgi:peptidoglycan/LPS O-acetylase OafA/YrhL